VVVLPKPPLVSSLLVTEQSDEMSHYSFANTTSLSKVVTTFHTHIETFPMIETSVREISLYLLVGLVLRNISPANPVKRPADPMTVEKILSDVAIGCTHTNIKIVIPPKPNNAFRNTPEFISLIVLTSPYFY